MKWWHAGARTDAPETRRFISPDPEAGNVYEPQRINKYIYAGDNPLNYIDPDGRYYISVQGRTQVDNTFSRYGTKAVMAFSNFRQENIQY